VKLVWADEAWEDYTFWQGSDPDTARKINELVKNIRRTPFKGLGKPEPLKGPLSGWWSRRITGEHRLVYRVVGKGEGQALEILQCRLHY
jgi:toxin YoeB